MSILDCEIVHRYLLAEQEGKDKKLGCFCTAERFYVKNIGRPVGDPSVFESNNVDDLLAWVREKK